MDKKSLALKAKIEAIFEDEKLTHQSEVLVEIYKLFFPDWDNIIAIEGHPTCDEEMWKFICEKFIIFDGKYHPGVMQGGLWLNMGFSGNKEMKPWTVNISTCTCEFKLQKAA